MKNNASQTVAVIHTAFEDKPSTVAFVKTKEGMSLSEKLEYAYRWTQNIMDSWSLKMPEDGNDDVTDGKDNVEVTVTATMEITICSLEPASNL